MTWWRPKETSPPARQLPTVPLSYPSDVFVETESGVYFIKGKSKFKVHSERVLASWRVGVLAGTDASVSKFKTVGTLGFRNGTLVRNFADGKFYLISENKRRHIRNPDVFNKYGFDTNNILVGADSEINLHEEGEVLS